MYLPQSELPLIIVISGPTASGKTELAMQLQDQINAELINMDSAQVYQDMEIGTAKITAQEKKDYPHHLMDIIEPNQTYSVAKFVADVNQLVPQIRQKNRIPTLVGGTPLYFNALLNGLSELPPEDKTIRLSLNEIKQNKGTLFLHHKLSQIDPYLARTVSENDGQRLVRFLEVAQITQKPPSEIFKHTKKNKSLFNFFHIKFFPNNRSWLHQRIETRFDQMLAEGFIDEVKYLVKTYQLSPDMPSMKCAGYQQIIQYLNGNFNQLRPTKNNNPSNTAYQEMRDRSVFATRQLAKRQITWLRKFEADITIDPSSNIVIDKQNQQRAYDTESIIQIFKSITNTQ